MSLGFARLHGTRPFARAAHVRDAVCKLDGVTGAEVLVSAERAVVTFDPHQVTPAQIAQAITASGYTVPAADHAAEPEHLPARDVEVRM